MTENNGPIFIGGLDRCGKTLLRALLVSHPRIAIPEIGSNYWTFFYNRYGDLNRNENLERCLADMRKYTHVTLINPDFGLIRRDFKKAEPTYERLFALFNQQYADRLGKPRWGDQTGLIERFTDQVLAAYKGSKMIHLIRDPRDRYEASITKHPNGQGKIGGATARWLLTTRMAQHNLKKYPTRYKIIQYENLVRETEKTLKELCDFLEEDFVPEMMQMTGAPEFRKKILSGAYGSQDPNLISTEFIGRYKGRIASQEIAFMQSFAGKKMKALGYELEKINFSLIDWIKFFSKTFPDNWIRMKSWLLLEKVQRQYPAQFGKPPPKDKVKLVNA